MFKILILFVFQISIAVLARGNARLNLFLRHHGHSSKRTEKNLDEKIEKLKENIQLKSRKAESLKNIKFLIQTSVCSAKACHKCEHFMSNQNYLKPAGTANIFCPTLLNLPGCCPHRLLFQRF